ncbi:acyl carrier protein phosphodiesterase [Alloalcanivorax mobilis]|uniref:acyl carrier protein phosphodiesterase n=1 Tax=Alloalcanivorax mobilis TaxID=2019569 RepID=UPI000C77EA10|nr:acyl carrier protein phosphodiesterase [Alloalcanivorax mobilis]
MNYFAHLALAQPTVASKVGNLMGDFMRGVQPEALPEPVRQGLHNHRLVDRFTDHHPLVIDSRRRFSDQRRRFAGVALDVLFDHFLIRHWSRFHERPLQEAIDENYRLLLTGAPLMPEAMRATTRHMVEHDWFNRYAELEGIGRALDRIAARIRFTNRFQGMLEEIHAHHDELEAVFLTLYPQLRQVVRAEALETPGQATQSL